MVTTESVELHFEGYSISAEVTLVDGVAHEIGNVHLETDSTSSLYIHPSDLTKHATRKLFDLAENQHDKYMLGDCNK